MIPDESRARGGSRWRAASGRAPGSWILPNPFEVRVPFSKGAIRALFLPLAALLLGGAGHAAPARPEPHFVGGRQPDQAEGRQALQDFRAAGPAGDYWMEFELRVMPHRGEESLLRGQIFGARSALGPLTRLDAAGRRWLIQSGPQPAAWEWDGAGRGARRLSAAESLQPLAGTELTPFDLQMPFLYWDDFIYEGLANLRGRPAYSLLLYPPAELAAARPDLAAVRVALDTQFHALVQAEMLGPKGESLKTITVLDLKKTGEQWIVKSIDLRNPVTRDKTRFSVTAVALDLRLERTVFTPEGLATALTAPAGARIERF